MGLRGQLVLRQRWLPHLRQVLYAQESEWDRL